VNWSRGLLRLWIAASVLWVGLVAVFLYIVSPVHTPGDLPPGAPPPPEGFVLDVNDNSPFWIANIPIAAMWAIAVPGGLFIAGWTSLWIGRGFRSPKP
jgi:hypothetical protein